MDVARWLRGQVPLAGHWLRLAVGLGLLSGLLLILQAWLLAEVVNAVIFQQAALADVMPWLWPMLGLFLLRAGLAWAAEQAGFQGALRVKLELRDRTYRKIQQLGPAWLAEQRTGDLINSLSDGIESLEAYYARYLPAVSLMALVPLAILAFVLPADWISALILLITAPLIPFFMILIGQGSERMNQKHWRRLARLSAHFLDVLQGLTSLKLFNASRREAEVIARISDEYRRSTMSVLRLAFLSSLVLEFLSTVSIALVAVSIGFRLLWGEMDFLYGFFVLLLAPEFYLPLRSMGTHYHARMEAIGGAERLVEILQAPVPAAGQHPADWLESAPSRIRLEQVEVRYPDGRIGLNGVSLELRAGEHLAVVGPSGAGKTTLANLLLGFVPPTAGQVLVDGRSVETLGVDAWRSHLAWVPQRPHLFQGSLLENIRLGSPHAELEDVERAARLARVDEFLGRLPDGYRTQLGDGGTPLSGGQIQRIALARALLRDAALVILDEPTASLDPESETLIQEALANLRQGRTLVTIAHRLHTVRHADRILVLNEGRVVEQGSHLELVASQGTYSRMLVAYQAGAPA